MKGVNILLLHLCLAILAFRVYAQDRPAVADPRIPLDKMLKSDGTLNIPEGFRGSLDPNGWRMMTGPDGKPRFIPAGTEPQTEMRNQPIVTNAAGDEMWDDRFYRNGMDGGVNAIAIDASGDLYVAGYFTTAGRTRANNIAKWDGSEWLSLGSGIQGFVYALTFDASGDLIAGGFFSTAGGVTANSVARWDGSNWSGLGNGVRYFSSEASVYALAVDASGNLYAGGQFTTAGDISTYNIAMWAGGKWTALGDGIGTSSASIVVALAADGGILYAGGSFSSAGGVPASSIAKWEGGSWSALGSGLQYGSSAGSVYALAVDGSGKVYAGGYFNTAGGVSANNIATWEGSTWSALGTGVVGNVSALATDVSGNLLAGGYFTSAGGVPAKNIAEWDGANWTPFAGGTNSTVRTLVFSARGNLYAGGYFTSVGGIGAYSIAKWDGSSWSAFGNGQGLDNGVFALAGHGTGNIYASGYFTIAGGIVANRIARWDGSAWSALGSGVDNYGIVSALAVDGSGDLYAGGQFTGIGGVPANGIAKWNGEGWSALGKGTNVYGSVMALALDGDGSLYAGGYFATMGDVTANSIAKWNGNSWSALGKGLSDYGNINALAVDGSGNLYAGGFFTTMDGVPANSIAKWDGSSWSALASGFENYGSVNALVVDGSGKVYAGGYFNTAGGVSANNIAKWEGSTWSALGTGVAGNVSALATDVSGNLYAGGYFTMAGDISANKIAKWDGSSWSALGSGIMGSVSSLYVEPSGDVYAGGYFSSAGDKISLFFARYGTGTAPVVTTHPDDQSIINGSSATFASTATGDPTPTLQWQQSTDAGATWGNIAGATTSPLTLSTVSFSENGFQYRACFANSVGTVYSDAATLTVKVHANDIGPFTIFAAPSSDDNDGCRVDFVANLYKNETLVGTETLKSQLLGGSSLKNAKKYVVPLSVGDVDFGPNDRLNASVSVRRAEKGKNFGVSFWLNADSLDRKSNGWSRILKSIAGGRTGSYYYFRSGDSLSPDPGSSGVAKTVTATSTYQSFGTWTIAGSVMKSGPGAGQTPSVLPTLYELDQNYPNPFNPSTTIRYGLPQASYVTLTIYNTLGQQVGQLVNEQQQAGYHSVVFPGEGLASGVYLSRLTAGGVVQTCKMLLVR